ncbi:MAG TPA: hypothetical protein VND83_09480 [Acidimicrobiales bacterium]|nr:hypothetical protein [Acidimicrobiales bacterium]
MSRPLYIVLLTLAAAVGVWLVITGARQESAWTAFTALHCSQPGSNSACMNMASRYYSASQFSTAGVWIGVALPGLLGLVLGTPLVAIEFDQRTNRLGWTQSITRTKWLGQKLLVSGSVAVVFSAALVPVLWWWTRAVQRPHMVNFDFDVSGVVIIAYALFAFALGALLGTLMKRAGYAFAVGVAVFAVSRFLERSYVRVRLVPTTFTRGVIVAPSNAWVVNEGYVPLDRSTPGPGLTWQSGNEAITRCAARAGGIESKSYIKCAKTLKLHWINEIQPASHFWSLQWAEVGVFVAVSAALLTLTVLTIRR